MRFEEIKGLDRDLGDSVRDYALEHSGGKTATALHALAMALASVLAVSSNEKEESLEKALMHALSVVTGLTFGLRGVYNPGLPHQKFLLEEVREQKHRERLLPHVHALAEMLCTRFEQNSAGLADAVFVAASLTGTLATVLTRTSGRHSNNAVVLEVLNLVMESAYMTGAEDPSGNPPLESPTPLMGAAFVKKAGQPN